MIKSIKIKDSSDNNYLRDEIDCFEKVIGIALDYHIKDASQIYFVFKKIIEIYGEDNNLENDEITFLSQVLGFKCNNYSGSEDFAQGIENAIDNNLPVLISADMYHLYYSDFYMEKHHGHLFLITGYDSVKKIYNILDENPWTIYKGEQYVFQKLEYSTIKKVYENDSLKLLMVLDKQDKEEFNYIEAIKYCINLYLNRDFKFISEEKIIKSINENIDNNHEAEVAKLINIRKFRKVLLNELLKLLNSYMYDSERITDLQNIKDSMFENTMKSVNRIIKSIYMNQQVNIDEYKNQICGYEMKIGEILREYLNEFNEVSAINPDKHYDKYSIYNNEDNIIKEEATNNFLFSFGNKKIYNSWNIDYCPKVLYPNNKRIFEFIVDVEVEDGFEEVGFLSGIIIKTECDSIYFYGINSSGNLLVQKCGMEDQIDKSEVNQYNIKLFVKVENKKVILGYKKHSKEFIVSNIELDSQVSDYGIGTKTWINGEKLITNFKINQNSEVYCNGENK